MSNQVKQLTLSAFFLPQSTTILSVLNLSCPRIKKKNPHTVSTVPRVLKALISEYKSTQ